MTASNQRSQGDDRPLLGPLQRNGTFPKAASGGRDLDASAARAHKLLPAAESHLGRRTALTLPLLPPPQKN
jgi:hypothetical protein